MSYSRAQLLADLDADIAVDEGTRLRLYYDSRGVPTIGRGRNLRDVGISAAECDMLTHDDIDAAEALLDAHVSWWRALPEGPARVIVNLCFNLGWGGLSGFHRFLAAMERSDWAAAAAELRDSDWWNQVGERGPRMVARLLDGTPPAGSAGTTEQST